MTLQDLQTKQTITWCPGCFNFAILNAVKQALADLVNEKKINKKNLTLVADIGCGAKIYDYLDINAFYSLHGRVIPTLLGIRMGNPYLIVLGFAGDGGTYAEGAGHFVHACHFNFNATMIVHNNQTFALTTGQNTPVSPKDFKGKSTPLGLGQARFDPVEIAKASKGTFIARAWVKELDKLIAILKKAIMHKGFSLVDIVMPCLAFNNIEKKPDMDFGILREQERKIYEENWPQLQIWHKKKRKIKQEIINKFKQ